MEVEGRASCADAIEAWALRVQHIDAAEIYNNESEVGEAIEECEAKGLVTRADLFVTSKLWNSDHSRMHRPYAQ